MNSQGKNESRLERIFKAKTKSLSSTCHMIFFLGGIEIELWERISMELIMKLRAEDERQERGYAIERK